MKVSVHEDGVKHTVALQLAYWIPAALLLLLLPSQPGKWTLPSMHSLFIAGTVGINVVGFLFIYFYLRDGCATINERNES